MVPDAGHFIAIGFPVRWNYFFVVLKHGVLFAVDRERLG